MRRKKHKATRRIVKYYKLHFGFREPYKVLLDGNFLHAMTQLKYANVEGILKDLLGGAVKLLVPTCAIRELKALAKDDASFKPAVTLAKSFMRHKDECPPNSTCTECLLRQTENNNEQHWWLATQDKDIQHQMRKGGKLGIPIIYASLSGVHLLPPSEEAQAAVSQRAETQMVPSEHELQSDVLANLPPLHRQIKGTAASFKRHKARGPNPLAAKKKIAKGAPTSAPAAAPKRIRRPNRPKANQEST